MPQYSSIPRPEYEPPRSKFHAAPAAPPVKVLLIAPSRLVTSEGDRQGTGRACDASATGASPHCVPGSRSVIGATRGSAAVCALCGVVESPRRRPTSVPAAAGSTPGRAGRLRRWLAAKWFVVRWTAQVRTGSETAGDGHPPHHRHKTVLEPASSTSPPTTTSLRCHRPADQTALTSHESDVAAPLDVDPRSLPRKSALGSPLWAELPGPRGGRGSSTDACADAGTWIVLRRRVRRSRGNSSEVLQAAVRESPRSLGLLVHPHRVANPDG